MFLPAHKLIIINRRLFMEQPLQLFQTTPSSSVCILLAIKQLSEQYFSFIGLLKLSQEQTDNLNVARFHFALLGLKQSITTIGYINDPEGRLSYQNKISANLNGLEGFFQCENQVFISSPQTAQEFTRVISLFKELKDMLTQANLGAPQASVSLHEDNKSLLKRQFRDEDATEDREIYAQRSLFPSMPG